MHVGRGHEAPRLSDRGATRRGHRGHGARWQRAISQIYAQDMTCGNRSLIAIRVCVSMVIVHYGNLLAACLFFVKYLLLESRQTMSDIKIVFKKVICISK